MAELSNRKLELFARELAKEEPLFGEREASLLRAMGAAGYKPSLSNGRKYRQRHDVQERIVKLRAAHADFVCADIGRLVQEQAFIAFADIAELFDGNGDVKAIATLPRSLTCAIKEISFDKQGRPKIKMHDKMAALAALQQYRQRAPLQPDLPLQPVHADTDDDEPRFDASSEWNEVAGGSPSRPN